MPYVMPNPEGLWRPFFQPISLKQYICPWQMSVGDMYKFQHFHIHAKIAGSRSLRSQPRRYRRTTGGSQNCSPDFLNGKRM